MANLNKVLTHLKIVDSKQPVALLIQGSMNPIHKQHINILEVAKKEIENRVPNLKVVGGFIATTSDNWVKGKLGEETTSLEQRIEMIKLTVKDSDWIEIDEWGSRPTKDIAIQTTEHLSTYLNNNLEILKYCQNVKCFYICGEDLVKRDLEKGVKRFKKLVDKGFGVIIVGRENKTDWKKETESSLDTIFGSSSWKSSIYLADGNDNEKTSSTKVRNILRGKEQGSLENFLHPEVQKYIELNGFFENRISEQVVNQIKDFLHSKNCVENLTLGQKLVISGLISDEKLRNRYKQYGLCLECHQPNIFRNWCKHCNSQHFQQDFSKWTSGSLTVDNFIQESQLKASNRLGVLEWIPYEQFTDIEYLGKGGFGIVFKAKWSKGPIANWNVKNSKWKREESSSFFSGEVALKSLANSQELSADFLREITCYKLVGKNDLFNHVVECYGISKNPQNKNYIMVMNYKKDGNLRQYLKENYGKLELKIKIRQLENIAKGLKNIHEQGLVHRDFHSGNILKEDKDCYITDLGLCRPANEIDKGEKVFGVLPYIAPEVLRGQPYTQASDVYSFGMVAYEFLANTYPYYEYEQDETLAIRICRGFHPDFKIKIPSLLEELIKKCLDIEPLLRSTASELYNSLDKWYKEVKEKNNTLFYQQYQEVEKEYNYFSQNTPYRMCSVSTLTSKPINTKQITERLKTYSTELVVDFTQFSLENKEENNNHNWTTIDSNFTEELIQQWQNLNFTYQQTQDWINIGLQPTDYNFCAWLRNIKHLTVKEILNHGQETELRKEYQDYQQLQSHQELPPKSN